MKKILLLLLFVAAAVLSYRWFQERNLPPPVAPIAATPITAVLTPPPRRVTPTPRPNALDSPLKTGHLTETPAARRATPYVSPLEKKH